jgi:hypothetical protein
MVLATIRAVETWSTGSVIGGITLLVVALAAALWAIRVTLRR